MYNTFEEYIKYGYTNIEGWLNNNLLYIAKILHNFQKSLNISGGGACEIGVHHGKFFIPLALLKKEYKSVAIDVFSLPFGNVDHSGNGDLEIFKNNLSSFNIKDNTSIYIFDSLHISSNEVNEIIDNNGKFSMFSIDGSHTKEHTYNDIVTAEQLTQSGGIIFIDDFFSPDWPGVYEGIFKYFYFHNYKFVPLCVCFNKLILIDFSYYRHFFTRLNNYINKIEKFKIKNISLFSYDCLLIKNK